MFKILRKTVNKVNEQTKSYFVSKLQVYDDLIAEKEDKLKEIEKKIEEKREILDNIDEASKKKDYAFDPNIIDIMNDADYKDKYFSLLSKKIDNDFAINYENIINYFVMQNNDDVDYEICKNMRDKFDSETIYEVKNEFNLDKAILKRLTKEEIPFYLEYKRHHKVSKIEDFLNYLDELLKVMSPYIEVQVGNVNDNYDYISKYVKTVLNDSIYKGIKIIYKNKVYDFSLNERNV